MSLSNFRESLGDFAKDVRVNLGVVLTSEGAPGLTESQIQGVALAAAYATKSESLVRALQEEFISLTAEEKNAAKSAAALMAMNNQYYRFLHLYEDKAIGKLPARLRMTLIANPGIAKVDFELYCLGVSVLNACQACVNAHGAEVKKHGVADEGIQSVARIAAVVFSAAQADFIQKAG